EPPSAIRLSADLGADTSVTPGFSSVSLSTDGKALAFVASKTASDKPQIYLRKLDQLRGSPMAGTEGARDPFFSPDGQWIAFFADGKLKKISVTGGAALTLCDAANDRGGAWAKGGFIVFAPDTRVGLFRVSAAGGAPEPLTKLAADEVTHRWPQVLPDGRTVLFTASLNGNNFDDANIVVESIQSGE